MADQPGCPCSICDEDSGDSGVPPEHGNDQNNLRARIAAALKSEDERWHGDPFTQPPATYDSLADAVIRELDMGIPCAATGCRMRQIASYVTDWIAPNA